MSATKTKKGLSLLLAIIMLFSMMPTTIFTLGASDNLPVMMATATSGDFHAYKGQVVTVTFLDYIDEVEYAACSPYAWDISASSATGTVKAWMKVNSAETEAAGETRYDVYIGGNGGVAANENSADLFWGFSVMKAINGLENLDTSNVVVFSYMFQQCYALEHLDLSSFDTSSAQKFIWTFTDCRSLKTLNLAGWDTSNVTTMDSMFKNCYALEVLDVSSFDTRKATNMSNMFYQCKSLTTIYVGNNWTVANASGNAMFNCCYAIVGGIEEYEKNFKYIPPDKTYAKLKEEGGFLTYKAPEAAEKYTVTYSFTGDVVPENVILPTAIEYEEGTTVTVEANPTAEGYIFSGWTTEDATVEDGKFVINKDVQFVGEWSKAYEVNYKYIVSGYEVPTDAPELPATVTYKAGDKVDVEHVPYVDGYVFEGWTTTDVEVKSNQFIMPAENVTLYGYFRKPVEQLEISGIPEDNTITIKEGADDEYIHVFVNGEVATTDGVEFKSNDETIVKVDENGKLTPIKSGETTITVTSKDNKEIQITINVVVEKYKVIYKFKGTVIPDNVEPPVDPNGDDGYGYPEGREVEVLGNPTADGYVFLGWTKDGEPVELGDTFFMPANDVEIVGTWRQINYYDVIYEYEGDIPEDLEEIKTKSYKEESTVSVEDIPSVPGYTFTGWETRDAYVVDNEFVINNNVHFVGTWSKNSYPVRYEYIGEVPANAPEVPKTVSYDFGTGVVVEAVPTLEGYTFLGWTPTNVKVVDGGFDMPAYEVVLQGEWIKNSYPVRYEYIGVVPADAPKVPDTVNYDFGEDVEVADAPTPAPDGYRFSGWVPEDDDVKVNRGIFYMPAKEVVLVGSWEKIPEYKVTYEYVGDVIPTKATDLPSEKSHREDSIVNVAPDAKADGYIFSGWTTEDTQVSKGKFVITNDVRFVGSWKKIEVKDIIVVNKGNAEIKIGENVELEITVTPETTLDKDVIITSSDENVIKIDENGKIIAVGGGTAVITVASKTNPSIKEEITIKVKHNYNVTYKYVGDIPANAPVVPDVATYAEGTTVDVKAAATLDGYIFSGWSTDYATVSDGEFVINNDVEFVGSWKKIEVEDIVVVNKGNAEIEIGDKVELKITVKPETTLDKDVIITSSDDNVIKIDENGKIIAVGGGTAVITVASKTNPSIKEEITIKVKHNYNVTYKYVGDVPANAPAVPGAAIYAEGTTVDVKAAATLDGYIFSGWSTNDATVSGGKFVIYNDVEFVGSWTLIKVGDVTGITAPDKIELVVGEEGDVNAKVNDDAINKKLHYSSDNEAVVSVDANGKITINGVGKANITVVSDANPAIFKVVVVTVEADPESDSEHYMVFGKTEKIGWYLVSINGGEWIPKGGNSHLVIPHGAEVTIKARDVFGDPFTFYVNGEAVTPNEDNSITITVNRYVLVGALGIPVIAPDAEEGLTWIQQIIQSIRDFFARIKSWFTKK